MFNTFPTKPIAHSAKPLHRTRHLHRSATIYEPNTSNLPARPQPVLTQPDRPIPVIRLPGLPLRPVPKYAVKSRFKDRVLKDWLVQFIPFMKHRSPEATPRTATFVNAKKGRKGLADFDHTLEDNYDFKPIPLPLYTKAPPEGGVFGWLAVAGAFLVQFCTIGYLFTWGVFEEHYTHVTMSDQSPWVVRLIGSFQLFLAFSLSLVAGKLADAGYFYLVVLSGTGLFAACLYVLSLVGEEQYGLVFLCQALGMGTGMGLVFVPTSTVSLHYFKRLRGLALGIVMSGGAFGGMIFPPILRALIPQRGLGGAIRVTAYIVLGSLLVGNCLLTIPPKDDKDIYPLPRVDLLDYAAEWGYIFAAIGTCLAMLVIFFPAMYLEVLGLDRGVDPGTSFNTGIILSFTGAIGGILLGYISDRCGIWNIMIPASGGLALTLFTTFAVRGPKSLIIHSIFYGFFSGAWLSLMVTALSSLSSSTEEMGTRVGLVLTGSSPFSLLSFIVQDALLGTRFNWAVPSIFSGLLLVGVTVLAYLSRTKFAAAKSVGRKQYIIGIQAL